MFYQAISHRQYSIYKTKIINPLFSLPEVRANTRREVPSSIEILRGPRNEVVARTSGSPCGGKRQNIFYLIFTAICVNHNI
jgi:hypothetical protein